MYFGFWKIVLKCSQIQDYLLGKCDIHIISPKNYAIKVYVGNVLLFLNKYFQIDIVFMSEPVLVVIIR